MPPTLNMPCRLLMSARALKLSSSEPSVLMATSNRLIEAPKISIAGSQRGHARELQRNAEHEAHGQRRERGRSCARRVVRRHVPR
jgi:hypothetical protein